MNAQIRIKCLKGENNVKKSFDGLIVRLQQASFALIYRLPYSKKNPVQMLTFLEKFPEFFTLVLKENSLPTILGDCNIPWNSPDHIDTHSLAEMLSTFNLLQLFQIHKAGNTLDWIIHRAEQKCIQNITKSDFLSDHYIIEWNMRRDPSQTVKTERLSRNIKDIDIKQFETDLKNRLEIPQKNANIYHMYQNYIKDITSIIEKHKPITRRQLTNRKTKHGMTKMH